MTWVLAGMSLTLALACGEVTLRRCPLPAVHRIRLRQASGALREGLHPRGLYTLHPAIGWTLTPHFSGRFHREDFDIAIQANGDGLRDHDYGPKPAGTYRIMGLGDSFAFGWGVESEECFYKVLQRRLNQAGTGRRVEVVNGGIPGFGTYESLQLLTSIGLSYDPDLVILAFYEGNDYQNNGEAPRARVIDDGYLRDAPRGSGIVRWLTRRSVLAALIDTQIESFVKKRAFKAYVEKTERLLMGMRSVLNPRGIPLVLVLIPDQDAAFYARPGWARRYDRLVSGMDLYEARRKLETFSKDRGIWFCQLSERFEHRPGSFRLRLHDTHFNAEGHAASAEEIDRFLRRTVLARWRI